MRLKSSWVKTGLAASLLASVGLINGGCAKWRAARAQKALEAQQAAEEATQPKVGPELRVATPVAFTVHATGNQIYIWASASGADPVWTLKGPAATFKNDAGTIVGKHYMGPTWEAIDGSKVTGKRAAELPSPDPDSAPWLLIEVTANSGAGVMSNVTEIQRINTVGGKAPSKPGAKIGEEMRVAYSADYVFHAPKSAPPMTTMPPDTMPTSMPSTLPESK